MKTTAKNITLKYDSLGAFGAACAVSAPGVVFQGQRLSSLRNDSGFTGTENFETANNLLLFGDSDNAAKLSAAVARFDKTNYDYSRRRVMSVAGFSPCVPAYLAGLPLTMHATNKTLHKKPVINLVYSCSIGSNVAAADIISAGAAFLSAIKAIEGSGVRVGLSVAMGARAGRQTLTVCTRAKNPDQFLDINKLAYCIINPSFLRRHLFRIIENNVTDSGFLYGYGSPCGPSDIAAALGVDSASVVSYYQICRMSVDEIIDKIKTLQK